MFHQISKHREMGWKNEMQQSFFKPASQTESKINAEKTKKKNCQNLFKLRQDIKTSLMVKLMSLGKRYITRSSMPAWAHIHTHTTTTYEKQGGCSIQGAACTLPTYLNYGSAVLKVQLNLAVGLWVIQARVFLWSCHFISFCAIVN